MLNALSIVAKPAGRYVHWRVVLSSSTHLLVNVAMIILFIRALVLTFGTGMEKTEDDVRCPHMRPYGHPFGQVARACRPS